MKQNECYRSKTRSKHKKVRKNSWRKGISPNICILCVRVIINKRSFEPCCVWILLLFVSAC